MEKRIRWPWFTTIPSVLVLLAMLAIRMKHYTPTYPLPFYILTALAIAALLVTGGYALAKRSKTGRSRWAIELISIIVGTLVLVGGSMHGIIVMCFGGVVPIGLYHSPNGTHTIVALECGLIDHFYSAYPVELGLFYHDNRDVFVEHNEQSPKDIKVSWLDDNSVRVYIIYDPAVGPVEEDSILVSFN